jgi:hypothetical protein
MHKSTPVQLVRLTIKDRIWLFGTSAWIVGIIDRSIAIFSSGNLTAINIVQLFLATVFFGGWLYLKPRSSSRSLLNSPMVKPSSHEKDPGAPELEIDRLSATQAIDSAIENSDTENPDVENPDAQKELSLCGRFNE